MSNGVEHAAAALEWLQVSPNRIVAAADRRLFRFSKGGLRVADVNTGTWKRVPRAFLPHAPGYTKVVTEGMRYDGSPLDGEPPSNKKEPTEANILCLLSNKLRSHFVYNRRKS